jgi:hypothetical protein
VPTSYKERCEEWASTYWNAKEAGDVDLAQMIWDAFDCIEPDAPPPIPCLHIFAWSHRRMPGGRLLYSGSGGGDGMGGADWLGLDRYLLKHGFVEIEEWEDGCYRAVWILDTPKIGATFTYCEGDISCVVFQLPAERGAFCAEIADADTFYRR